MKEMDGILKKTKGFFGFSFNRIIESLRFNKRCFYAALFEVLFFASLFGFLVIFGLFGLMPLFEQLQHYESLLVNMASSPQDIHGGELEGAKSLVNQFKIMAFFALFAIFALYVIFKSLVWKFIKEIKFTKVYFLKSALVNAAIFIFTAILVFSFNMLLKEEIFPYLIILFVFPLYIHMNTIFNSSIENSPGKNFIDYGIKKIHYFIFSHIIVLIVFILLLFLFSVWFTFVNSLSVQLAYGPWLALSLFSFTVFAILFMIFLVWVKRYILFILKGLKEVN